MNTGVKPFTFRIILAILPVFYSGLSSAQSKAELPPLATYLQVEADTSILLHYNSSWEWAPNWKIISKKQNLITAYEYTDPNALSHMPFQIRQDILKAKGVNSFDHQQAAMNAYLNAIPMPRDTLSSIWNSIMFNEPWKLKDDSDPQAKCENVTIMDAGGITLYLVTAKDIKRLVYNAPDLYFAYCPTQDRAGIMRLSKLFARLRSR